MSSFERSLACEHHIGERWETPKKAEKGKSQKKKKKKL
jgi:hypothetical protein